MTRKIARVLVKYRIAFLILCVVAAALGTAMVSRTNINYDLSAYLDEQSMTKRALKQMEAEFGQSEVLRVMFLGLDEETFEQNLATLQSMDEVAGVSYDAQTDCKEVSGKSYHLVSMMLGNVDAVEAVRALREAFSDEEHAIISGSAASSGELQARIASEIPLAMAVAVGIVLVVLLLTSHAWIEPLLVLFTLLLSILINMGTNFIFPSISFITYAVSAILQLALSMDYGIILLNAYHAALKGGLSAPQAIEKAVHRSIAPIFSSALTTVAGLMSLALMSFSIGIDIGVVLSKGVVISLMTVFLFLPGLILMCSKALKKTQHKTISLGGARLGEMGVKTRRVLFVPALIIFALAFYLQSGTTFIFSDMTEGTSARKIAQVFGENSTMALLVDKDVTDEGYARQRALVDELSALQMGDKPLVKDVTAMVTTGAQALEFYTAQQVAQQFGVSPLMVNLLFAANGWEGAVRADVLLAAAQNLMGEDERVKEYMALMDTAHAAFEGETHSRIVLNLNTSMNDEDVMDALARVLAVCDKHYGEDYLITGELMSSYDIAQAFEGDLLKVNIFTALAIFLILLCSFRSFKIAALLVAVIEGAIWITMAYAALTGEKVMFMAYLICVAIQIGATIDYGILLTSHYLRFLKSMEPKQALKSAMERALPTIFTSAIIFIGAGSAVGRLCSVYSIYAIGRIIARGALVSVVLVLFLLPSLLSLFIKQPKKTAPLKKGTDSLSENQ